MKSFIILLLIGIIAGGCENKTRKIEVVPNLESIYTSVNDVDTPPNEIEATKDIMTKSLVEAAKSLYDKNSGEPERFIIALRIYGNEKGDVDKIKDISRPSEGINAGIDTIKDYANNEKLVAAIAERMGDWKFEPAKINGKPVKCWLDIKVNFILKPDGTYSTELPDFLNDISFFNSKDNYLLSAQKMPELIGGIKALQERIKYPEIAQKTGIEGKVYILAYIRENGTVAKAMVIKGIGGGCDEAALNAVKQLKFTPAEQDGKPVKVQITIPVMFKLSSK